MSDAPERIYLSPPHMGDEEFERVREAFATNWIAPVGPHVSAFETEFAERVGSAHAVAVSSGTAALHLALVLAGVERGDRVAVSTFTFIGSVGPVVHEGAEPIFIDAEEKSWNLDPALVEEALEDGERHGRPLRAVVAVHLYGQSADLDPIREACDRHGAVLVEDAAEALGTTYRGTHVGTAGQSGIFSFNGNKIITTSGGGMLVTDDGALAERARKLATQAQDPAAHYQHSEVGWNYRLSNVLAGIGLGQLSVLDERIAARRRVFERYRVALAELEGVDLMPMAPWGTPNYWLTCITLDPDVTTCRPSDVIEAMEAENIEARHLWKPMHLQPVFEDAEAHLNGVSERLFETGVCLPSGSALGEDDLERIVGVMTRVVGAKS